VKCGKQLTSIIYIYRIFYNTAFDAEMFCICFIWFRSKEHVPILQVSTEQTAAPCNVMCFSYNKFSRWIISNATFVLPGQYFFKVLVGTYCNNTYVYTFNCCILVLIILYTFITAVQFVRYLLIIIDDANSFNPTDESTLLIYYDQ